MQNTMTFKELMAGFAELRASQKETGLQIKSLNKQLGGISNSNGCFAEDYFESAFEANPIFAGKLYGLVMANVRPLPKNREKQAQYDIVMADKEAVVIIEVKYKAHENDLEELKSKIASFKYYYPEYVNHKMFLGLASFHFYDELEIAAKKEGIAVVKIVGDKMIINDNELKVF